MSFWEFQDDLAVDGSFDAGGGSIEPIPDNTTCIAIVDEAKWDQDRDGNRYVSLRWSVLGPDDYKNRKVYQKLWVLLDKPGHKDPMKKRDKDKRMLAAIDFNAGGKLMASGKMPTDDMMAMALMNKPMSIKVMQWKSTNNQTGDEMKGNWISAVGPRGAKAPAAAPKPKAKPVVHDDDEDAPF